MVNEGELSLFGIMHDLGMAPSRQVYQSIFKRVRKLESSHFVPYAIRESRTQLHSEESEED